MPTLVTITQTNCL